MSADTVVTAIVFVGIFVGVAGLLLHSPIFKPWFGFRKPPGHPGKWGQ